MKFLLQITFFCLLGMSLAGPYQVENLDSSPGLLYDHLTKVVYASGSWKMVVYANTKQYDDKVKFITKSYVVIDALCKIKQDCPSFDRMDFLYRSVLDKATAFKQMTGSSAENVPHQIAGLSRNELANKVLALINKHEQTGENNEEYTTILKASLTYNNNTEPKMQEVQRLYEKNVVLYNDMENQKDKIKNDKQVAKDINMHTQAVSILALDVEKEFNALVDSLYYGQNRALHPDILGSQSFLNEVIKTTKSFNKPQTYPYQLVPENIHNLLHIVDLDIFTIQDKLVFIVSVPLVDDTVYNLYRLLPLPVQSSENTFVFIQPSSDNIAVSENNKKYVPMDILRYCTKLSGRMSMCRPEQVYSVQERPICEIELLSGKNVIPSNCNTRVVKNQLDIWHKLESRNAWLFIKAKSEDISVECLNANPFNVKLSKTGLLVLDPTCTARVKGTKYSSEGSSAKSRYEVSPSVSIVNDNCCNKEMVENTFKNSKPSTTKISNINLYNIKSISYKIKTESQ